MNLTWTKAVAIKTPVPKCLQKKKIFGGIFTRSTCTKSVFVSRAVRTWTLRTPLDLLGDNGEATATDGSEEHNDYRPYQSPRICERRNNFLQTAATCRGKSYTAASFSLPQVGFSILAIVDGIQNGKRCPGKE
jgi:hypothetical protein